MLNDMTLDKANGEVDETIQILRRLVDLAVKEFTGFGRSEYLRYHKQELQALADSIKVQ